MLTINSIARVIVTATRSAATPSAFDTGLLLAEDANFTAARRVQTYLSAQTAVTGFADLTETEYGIQLLSLIREHARPRYVR